MVTIAKGDKKIEVPKSAYNNFYKGHGWMLITSANQNKPEMVEEVKPEEDEWAGYENETGTIMKPLSEMNREEMEMFATEKGVDISKATSNRQIRDMLKKYI